MKQRKIATYLWSIIHMEDQVSQSHIPPEVRLYIVKDDGGMLCMEAQRIPRKFLAGLSINKSLL